MKINAVLFDGQEMPKAIQIENTLDGYYSAIGCRTFEGYSGTELGHLYGFDVYLDGEGKLHEKKPKITGVFVRKATMKIVDTIVGNVLILCHDDEGESISVVEGAESIISKHVRPRSETNIPAIWEDGFGKFETSPYLLVLYC